MINLKCVAVWASFIVPFGMSAFAPAIAGTPAQPAAKITLRVADSLPTTHIFSVGMQAWMKRTTELTNGQVQFQHFPNEQLGKRKDMFDMARNGTVDIAYVLPVDQPAQLGRATVVELPGFATLSSCGTPVLQRLIQDYLKDEWLSNGVRPLFALYVGGYEIFSNRDIHTPANLKGMKIRSAGGSQDVTVKALGAIPITLASPEVYEAVQRKTIDGVLFPWTGVPAWKLREVTKNATYGAALGATVLVYIMNEGNYQKLPQNVKDAMVKAAEDATPKMVVEQDRTLTDLVAEMKKGGMKVVDLNAAELGEWRKALGDVEKGWIDSMTRAGVKDPKSVIDKRNTYAAAAGCK